MSQGRVLVIDDEPAVRDALRQVIEYEGFAVRLASSGGEGLSLFDEFRPHVVLLDVKMAGLDGLEVLSRLKQVDPGAVVVMISGHGTIATAVQATHRGAFDFLEKPLDSDRLLVTLRNALATVALVGENERLKEVIDTKYPMVGSSAALRAVRELIARVGPTDARVLITGDNGTGKELVARAIHEMSPRRERAFVEVNCAAIPTELIESELFGHLKGSFTGAVSDRPGKFELADGGTLFLDEVGDLPGNAQAKLLRVLQESVVERVGGTAPVKVDVRVVAATNQDLEALIANKTYRSDLYFRLSVFPIRLPPLRTRRSDVSELASYFLRASATRLRRPARSLSADAVQKLMEYPWPGNVRELQNVMERAAILATTSVVPLDAIWLPAVGALPTTLGTSDMLTLVEAERHAILAALDATNWRISGVGGAADRLDMKPTTLHAKMKKLGIRRPTRAKAASK